MQKGIARSTTLTFLDECRVGNRRPTASDRNHLFTKGGMSVKRTLLAIMLLVSIAGAQTTLPYRTHIDSMTTMELSNRWHIHNGNMASFLTLYSRYEKECWKDSTVITGYPRIDWPATERFRQSGGSKFVVCIKTDTIRFDHHQPTFEGFIAWLRKQQ
jgi:hypothetical protein